MAIKIQNSTIIDDGRNIVNAGITTVTSVSIGNTQVISSSRQLQNIASLDATTTQTIEAAIANAPNTFTDINVTGVSTFTNGPVLIGSGTSTGTSLQRLQVTGNAYVSGDIGIGTTSPTAKLHVVGSGSANAGSQIAVFNNSLNQSRITIVDENASLGSRPPGVRSPSATFGLGLYAPVGPIAFYGSSDNEVSRFDTSGNLLIGNPTSTGTASQRLQVTGGGYFSGVGFGTGSVGIGITLPQGTLDIRTSPQWTGFNWGANLVIGGARNNSIVLLDNSNSNPWGISNGGGFLNFGHGPSLGNTTSIPNIVLTLNRANNFVGINSIVPGSTLAVGGTITELYAGQYWNVVTQADVGYGASQVPLNQYLGQLAFLDDFSPNGLRRDGGGEDDVTVNSSGFVGIGTTNAISKLHIIGGDVVIGVTSVGVGIGTSGSSGRVLMGPSTARSGFFSAPNVSPVFQIEGNTDNTRGISIVASHGTHPTQDAYIALCRQNSSVIGGHTAVIPGNSLGDISFQGSDSTQFVDAARIECYVDGGVGVGSMPGRIEFRTTPSGSFVPNVRMTINNSGNVLIGSATSTGTALQNLQVTGGGYFSGNVGLGRTNPIGRLHIPYSGTFGSETLRIGNEETTFSENIYSIFWGSFSGDTQTGIGPYPTTRGVTGRQGLAIHIKSTDEFSVKSSGWTNLFGIQGGTGNCFINGNLGIGSTSPTSKLQVVGNASISGNLTVSSSNATGGGIILSDDGDFVDLNDGFGSLRFSQGIRVYSGNKTGVPRITLASSGTVTALTYDTGVIGSQTSGILTTTATTANQVLDNLPTATFQTARYQVSIACTGQLVTAGMSTIVTSVGAITAGAGYTEATYTNVALTGGSGNDARANIGIGLSFNAVGFTSATDLIVTTSVHGLPSGVGTIAVSFASSIPNSDFTGIAVTAGAIYYAVGVGTTTLQLFNNANGTSQVTGIGTTTFTGVGNTMTKAGGVSSVEIVSPGSGYSPGNTLSATLGTLGSGFSFTVATAVRNYQSTDIMIMQSVGSASTACDYIEYGTIANSEVLGSFSADISGANARLLFTPTYRNNTIKLVRTGITV